MGGALMNAFERWAVESADVRQLVVATRRAEDFSIALGYERSATSVKNSVTDLL